jgi:hypothetical protein
VTPLFAVQYVSVIASTLFQLERAFTDTRGLSIVQFCLTMGFMLMGLLLARSAHEALKEELMEEEDRVSRLRETRESIIFYSSLLPISLFTITVVARNPGYSWTVQDSSALITAAVLSAAVLSVTFTRLVSLRKHGVWGGLKAAFRIPKVHAALAISFKSLPQLFLIWSVLSHGGSGIPGTSMILANFNIVLRLTKAYRVAKAARWNEGAKWLYVSEASNCFTWWLVTIAWFISWETS